MTNTNRTDAATTVSEADLKPGDVVALTGIEWDTTTDEDEDGDVEPGLPTSVTLTIPDGWEEGHCVADLLSDLHGYCVFSPGVITRA